jgi:hypothetical protein
MFDCPDRSGSLKAYETILLNVSKVRPRAKTHQYRLRSIHLDRVDKLCDIFAPPLHWNELQTRMRRCGWVWRPVIEPATLAAACFQGPIRFLARAVGRALGSSRPPASWTRGFGGRPGSSVLGPLNPLLPFEWIHMQ